MARLPQIQPRGAVTPQVSSSLSAGEIANPFAAIGDALGDVGTMFQREAVQDAAKEGANAISRDENGTLRIAPNPYGRLGERSDSYERAASQGFMARFAVDARTAAAQMAREANGNVNGFTAAWHGFVKKSLANVPRDLRGEVSAMLEAEGAQFGGGVIDAKRARDIKVAQNNVEAVKALYEDDLATLARAGGVQSPEYRDKFGRVRTLLTELAHNPDFTYSPQQAEIELKRIESRSAAEALVGHVDRTLAAKGIREATKEAESILTNKRLRLSPAERRRYHAAAAERISSYNAQVKVEVKALTDQAFRFTKLFDEGQALDHPDVDKTITGLFRAGKPTEANELLEARSSARVLARLRRGTPEERLSALEGLARQADGEPAPASRGENTRAPSGNAQQQAVTLLRGFEGFRSDPYWDVDHWRVGYGSDTTTGPNGSIRRTTKGSKVSRADAERDLARRVDESMAHAREKAGPAFDNLPANAQAAIASVTYNYGELPDRLLPAVRSGDPAAIARAIEALGDDNGGVNAKRRAKEAALAAGATTVQVDPGLVSDLMTEVTADTRAAWTDIKDGLDRGLTPAPDRVAELSRQLTMINEPRLRKEIAGYFQTSTAGKAMLDQVAPAEREAFMSALRADASAAGVSEAEQALIRQFEKQEKARTEALNSDPIGWSAEHNPEAGPVPALDPAGAPEDLQAALAARQRHVTFLRENGEVANVSAFRPADDLAVERLWQTGSPEQLRSFVDTMASTLTPDTLAATLSDKPMRDAITGAALSLSPERHGEAMRALDTMASQVGIFEVDRTYGKEVVDRLQEWQARVRYFTPEEATAWLKQRNDPDWQKRVKPLVDKGQAEARKIALADIVDGFDESWISDPKEPTDPATIRALQNDFVDLVGDAYAGTQDIGKAKEAAFARMKKRWGTSNAMGGRLMLFPPEAFYPPVDGDTKWIGRELADLATEHGVDVGNVSLVPDQKTQTAIQHGQAPGYLVSIIDPKTGLDELMTDDAGRPLRHFFDPQEAAAKATADAIDARRTQNDPWIVLPGGASIGPIYPPWRPETPADRAQRERRIQEILRERAAKKEAP